MKGCGLLLLYCFAFLLIGQGLSLHNQDATALGIGFAALALLASAWTMRSLFRAPLASAHKDELADFMGFGDPFQNVGLALTETAPFGEKRLVLNCDTRGGSLHAGLEGSQGALPVPQVVLAAIRDMSAHLQKQGKQMMPMRWTVTRADDGDWGVNVTFV